MRLYLLKKFAQKTGFIVFWSSFNPCSRAALYRPHLHKFKFSVISGISPEPIGANFKPLIFARTSWNKGLDARTSAIPNVM